MAYTSSITQRAKLHHRLIDIDDMACACGNKGRREIHRIIPGGDYTQDTVVVRCFNCHHLIDHPASKFRIGDRIRLNGRTPDYIDLERGRPRTIIAIKYNKGKQCNFYLLGSNGRGPSRDGQPLQGYQDYWFRSYQMVAYEPRRYHYHRQYRRVK